MTNVLDCKILVGEFELQTHYYISLSLSDLYHWEMYESSDPTRNGLNSTPTVLLLGLLRR